MARLLLLLLLVHLSSTALQITSSASHSTSTAMASSDPSEVEIEILPFIRVYKNGSIERLFGTDTVPASFDATTGVASKDVTIDQATGLSVRLYLPPAATDAGGGKKLPVLVYFHGGGFMVESAASPTYHRYLNALAARAGALVVSVDYRLVPEHPLPAAYDDSWAALAWAVAGCALGGREPWLAAHGDAARVFLAGDSAGANIAHNVALRAAVELLPLPPGAAIAGAMLVHPYFYNPSNAMEPELEIRIRRQWRFMCARPDAEVDDPRLCPTCAGASARLAALPCRMVMVVVAGDDSLAPRGRRYYAALLASGWGGEAELVDTPGQGHVFHLKRPGTEAAAELLNRVADFISGELLSAECNRTKPTIISRM